MTDGIKCNKCEKWFEKEEDIGIIGKERGYVESHHGFHLCSECSVKFATEWLTSHSLLRDIYKNVRRKEKWETV